VSSGWNLFHVTHLAPNILTWLLDFWKICAVLHYTEHLKNYNFRLIQTEYSIHDIKRKYKVFFLVLRTVFHAGLPYDNSTPVALRSCHISGWYTVAQVKIKHKLLYFILRSKKCGPYIQCRHVFGRFTPLEYAMSTRQIVTNVWKKCSAHLKGQTVREETPLFLPLQKVSKSLLADMA